MSGIFLSEANTQNRWDIFCKVVDNFGDIGICWRLAKQLNDEHGLQIRLWVDDLVSAQKIIPSLKIESNQQIVDNVCILKWHAEADFSQAADMVIEAFACELPDAYLAAMAQQKSKWVNLEYLSAEPWVEDFHAKPSPKPEHKLVRHFYFPGFTEKTGGLIREADITAQLQNLSMTEYEMSENALKISLFCYPNAPIKDLFTALQANTPGRPLSNPLHEFDSPCNQAVYVYVPQSSILPNIAEFFGKKSLQVGDKLTQNNLTVVILPFLSQADYDKLLSECDLNFVRGEDSWIRAIWAAKPFIWQPYIQDENAHMVKLNAFLDLFYAHYDIKYLPCKAHEHWSTGQLPVDVFAEYLQHLPDIKSYTQQQSAKLASQPDLAAKLVIFCNALYNP